MADSVHADPEAQALCAVIRAKVAGAPGLRDDDPERVGSLMAEVVPCVEAALRAERNPDNPALWAEARSLVWLFAYRMGDQKWPALAAAAVLPAWRDAVATEWSRRMADDAAPLVMDGYARGREDRLRADTQRALAESLPVSVLAPGVVLVVAAGALDADGAHALAERAGQLALHSDARGVLLDLGGLRAPDGATLAALWEVASSARMLGARVAVCGASPELKAAMESASLPDEGVLRAETLAAGFEALVREAGIALGGSSGWARWIRRVVEVTAGARKGR